MRFPVFLCNFGVRVIAIPNIIHFQWVLLCELYFYELSTWWTRYSYWIHSLFSLESEEASRAPHCRDLRCKGCPLTSGVHFTGDWRMNSECHHLGFDYFTLIPWVCHVLIPCDLEETALIWVTRVVAPKSFHICAASMVCQLLLHITSTTITSEGSIERIKINVHWGILTPDTANRLIAEEWASCHFAHDGWFHLSLDGFPIGINGIATFLAHHSHYK